MIVMSRLLWAGIDIGGTKTAVVVSANPPDVLSRTEFPTLPANGPQPAIEQVKATLRNMLQELDAGNESLAGIGVSCGGPLDSEHGIIQAPPNLSTWIDVPIVEILASEFGCPVCLENDANAGAVAEHRYGTGKGSHNMVFLTMGTGFGAGMILDGRIYRGTNGMAGEIGHVRLTADGPVGYHKAGSAEGWVSGGGLAQWATSAVMAARNSGETSTLLELPQDRQVTARDVGLAAENGDELARRIVTQCGEKLGMALGDPCRHSQSGTHRDWRSRHAARRPLAGAGAPNACSRGTSAICIRVPGSTRCPGREHRRRCRSVHCNGCRER